MREDGEKERWRVRVREGGGSEQGYNVVQERMWEDGEKERWRGELRRGRVNKDRK